MLQRTNTCMHTRTYICTRKHVHAHAYTHAYTHVCDPTHMRHIHTHTHTTHTHARTHTCAHTHTHWLFSMKKTSLHSCAKYEYHLQQMVIASESTLIGLKTHVANNSSNLFLSYWTASRVRVTHHPLRCIRRLYKHHTEIPLSKLGLDHCKFRKLTLSLHTHSVQYLPILWK